MDMVYTKQSNKQILPQHYNNNVLNNKLFNIAGKLSLNEWRGQSNVEFIIDDISVNKTFKKMVPSSIG